MKKALSPVKLLLLFFLLPGSIFAVAEEGLQLLSAKQAEERALKVDPSLQAAQINLDIAKKSWETEKRLLFITGNINNQRQSAGGDDTHHITKEVVIESNTVENSATESPRWKISRTETDSDSNPGDTYSFAYSPFNFNKQIRIKEKGSAFANALLSFETTKMNLIIKVRLDYGAVIQKTELYRIAQEELELAKENLNQTQALFQTGKIPQLDLMEIEQQVKASEIKVINAKLDRDRALIKLNSDLDTESLERVECDKTSLAWATSNEIDFQATLAKCLKEGPEVKAASGNIELAKINLQAAYFSQLNGLQVATSLFKPRDGLSDDVTTYSISMSPSLDDTSLINIKLSKKNLEAAEKNQEAVLKSLRSKIHDTYHIWEIAEQSLVPLQQSIEVAREKLRIVTLKYNLGLATGAEIIETTRDFTEANEKYFQGWFDLQQARENFYQAIWGKPVFRLN